MRLMLYLLKVIPFLIAAAITNYVNYANPSTAATAFVVEEVANDTGNDPPVDVASSSRASRISFQVGSGSAWRWPVRWLRNPNIWPRARKIHNGTGAQSFCRKDSDVGLSGTVSRHKVGFSSRHR